RCLTSLSRPRASSHPASPARLPERPTRRARRTQTTRWLVACCLLVTDPRVQVGDPFRNLLVVGLGLGVRLVVRERARQVVQIDVAQNREIALREMEPRVDLE